MSGGAVGGIGFAVSEETVREQLPNLSAGVFRTSPNPTPMPGPTPSVEWTTYSNTSYNYAIDIPPGWSVDYTDRRFVVIEEPSGMASVSVESEDLSGYTLQQASDGYIELLRSESIRFEIVDQSEVLLRPKLTGIVAKIQWQSSSEYCVESEFVVTVMVGSHPIRWRAYPAGILGTFTVRPSNQFWTASQSSLRRQRLHHYQRLSRRYCLRPRLRQHLLRMEFRA